MRVPLHDPFYVGIGVCSHNKDTVEKAEFSNVELTFGAPAGATPKLYSTLETVPVSGDRRVTYVAEGRLSVPTWTSDGDAIVFQSEAGLKKIPASGGKLEDQERFGAAFSGRIATGKELPLDGFRNYSLHLSPDGQRIAYLSCKGDTSAIPEDKDVMLRVLSLNDGVVRVVAKFVGGKGSMDAPSWSPDSRRLAFVSYQWIQ